MTANAQPPRTLRELANFAVDHKDAASAGRLVDAMRRRGFTYACALDFVHRTRPNVTAAEWDALLYESETPTE